MRCDSQAPQNGGMGVHGARPAAVNRHTILTKQRAQWWRSAPPGGAACSRRAPSAPVVG
jgi:hypothetical protein